jgi:hypothetical protein
MVESTFTNLFSRASFVFAGTVTSLGESSLQVLASRPGLAVVRFDRGFLVNPVLGKLEGQPITVQLTGENVGAGTLARGQRLIFFATGWVHGEHVAVSALAWLPADSKTEKELSRFMASLPERHLSERIAAAVLIVHGTVKEIARATDIPRTASEHDPYWMRAVIEVVEALKGEADGSGRQKRATAALLFPGTGDIAFRKVPRPKLHQDAVFLLHPATSPPMPQNAHVAPDSADIQPVSELPTIRRLLGSE